MALQAAQGWGAKVTERLARDLQAAFPEMKGFSARNLKYMRAIAQAWPEADLVQGVLAQLLDAAYLSTKIAVASAFLSITSTNSMAVAPPPLTRWVGCRPNREVGQRRVRVFSGSRFRAGAGWRRCGLAMRP